MLVGVQVFRKECQMDSFDMMVGRWWVTNRRLDERFADCDLWTEFAADYECWSHMDGRVSIDRMSCVRNGESFTGMSVRTLEADTGDWTIYWMDSNGVVLLEQVRGKFVDGEGVFHGEDIIDGEAYPLRFTWSNTSPDAARWTQAYKIPGTETWETNWTMDFYRQK